MNKNNFDFLRIVSSMIVVIVHGEVLITGSETELMPWFTHGQINLGLMALYTFFIISGFLIYPSLLRSDKVSVYIWKRFLRVYPSLFLALCFSLFMAYLFYDHHMPFWQNSQAWSYIPRNLSMIWQQFEIAGSFTGGHYQSINGSIWSFPYEEFCYHTIIFILLVKWKKYRSLIFLLAALSLYFIFIYDDAFASFHFGKGLILNRLMMLSMYFYFGAFWTSLRGSYAYFARRAVALFIVIIFFHYASIAAHISYQLLPLYFPLMVISIAYLPIQILHDWRGRIGDWSCGIYLFSFPLTQGVAHYFHISDLNRTIWFLCIASLAIGAIVWHGWEKKVLSYKDKKPSWFLPFLDRWFSD